MKEKKKGHVHCPVNGWDCPYWKENNICSMYPDADPIEECDDFIFFWDNYDDYVCYDDHEKE